VSPFLDTMSEQVPTLTLLSMIEYVNSHEGVEWMPLAGMAAEFRDSRISGVEIEGGAEG